MMNQRYCPFCQAAAMDGCLHLALVAEGRDFVRRCIELSQAQSVWQTLCQQRHDEQILAGHSPAEQEDFTWLETAFCERFLKHLRWYGGMDYEWRTGPRPDQGGFWVLLWSRDPRRLWWELRDDLERRVTLRSFLPAQEPSPWLIWLTPR